MLSKRNLVLSILLAIQLGLIALLYWPKGTGSKDAHRFFPALSPGQVTRLAITDGEKGITVTLRREDQGWVVGEAKYPVDEERLETVLDKLATLSSDRVVGRTPEAHARFKVGEPFNLKVVLADAAGGEHVLFVGSSPSYQTLHVRKADEDEVYMVRELAAWQIPADETFWWKREYVEVSPGKLTRVGLQNTKGTFTLVRKEDSWVVEGREDVPDQDKVRDFLNKVRRLALTEYLGREPRPEFGLDQPEAVLTLATDKETIEVRVGRKKEKEKEDEGQPVLKASSSPFYVTCGEFIAEPLLDTKVSDFFSGKKED